MQTAVTGEAIEVVDVSPLEAGPGPARDAMDRRLGEAAGRLGFLVISGVPVAAVTEPEDLRRLLALFALPEAEKRRLANRKHAPVVPRGLNVNFGDMLSSWTGGRLPATPHRVVAQSEDRHSIPFFFEPLLDAEIAPIPGAPQRPPVRYADHLWTKVREFATYDTGD